MRNIALKVAYDGTPFWGWQACEQPSIESALQKVIDQILQERVYLQAASRTDAGVHAEGLVVNFFTANDEIPLSQLKYNLNALLSTEIRIVGIESMELSFHPSLDAIGKRYDYAIFQGAIQLPKERLYAWHVHTPLDLHIMTEGAKQFIGEYDFSAFCNKRPHHNYSDTIRRLNCVTVEKCTNGHLLIRVEGTHFLYKMVRNIVGTLVDIGRGKLPVSALPNIFALKTRPLAGVTAPALGLTLKKIFYPQEIDWKV